MSTRTALRDFYEDQKGMIILNRLSIEVTILDAKLEFGNTRVLITPRSGHGTAWVDVSRIIFAEGIPPEEQTP